MISPLILVQQRHRMRKVVAMGGITYYAYRKKQKEEKERDSVDKHRLSAEEVI